MLKFTKNCSLRGPPLSQLSPWHSRRCSHCPLCTLFSLPSPLQCFQGNRENKDLNKMEPKKVEDAKPTPSQLNRGMCSVQTPAKGAQTSARGEVSTRHSTAGCFEDGSLLLQSEIPTTWCLLALGRSHATRSPEQVWEPPSHGLGALSDLCCLGRVGEAWLCIMDGFGNNH